MLFRSNDTATTEIYTAFYTLSLHDALPISRGLPDREGRRIIGGRLVAVELDDIESRLLRNSGDLIGRVRSKDSRAPHCSARRVQNRARLRRSDTPRAVGKHDAYVAGTYLGGEGCVYGARHAAELNFCEHPLSA